MFYAFQECQDDVHHIAMDLCHCNLEEYVTATDHRGCKISKIDALEQVTRGLDYLHDSCIVHRQLHPINILFHWHELCGNWRVKISGLSRCVYLKDDDSLPNCDDVGRPGYVAPELLDRADGSKGPGKLHKGIDVFAIGNVMYYTLSSGGNPFSSDNDKVRDEECVLVGLGEEYKDAVKPLILGMIDKDPGQRLSIKDVKQHHLFWSKAKKLLFLERVSNYINDDSRHKDLREKLEGQDIISDNWKEEVEKFGPKTRTILNSKHWKYDTSLCHLLRFIRNWSEHFYETDTKPELRQELGELPYKYVDRFLTKFPRLLPHVYEVMREKKGVPVFRDFYDVSESEKISLESDEEARPVEKNRPKVRSKVVIGKSCMIIYGRPKVFSLVPPGKRDLERQLDPGTPTGNGKKNIKTCTPKNLKIEKSDQLGTRDTLTAFSIKNQYIYAVAWVGYIFMADISRPNPSWKKVKATELLHGRYPPTAVIFDKFYICGGGWEEGGFCRLRQQPLCKVSKECEAYRTSDDGSLIPLFVPSMKEARRHNVVVAIQGKVYCIGGEDIDGRVLCTVEVYDPVNGSEWKAVCPLNIARQKAAAAAFGGKIYLMGGKIQQDDNNNLTTDTVEVYDIVTCAWSLMENKMIVPRSIFCACVCDSRLYVVGGDASGDDSYPAKKSLEVLHDGEWRKFPLQSNLEHICFAMSQ